MGGICLSTHSSTVSTYHIRAKKTPSLPASISIPLRSPIQARAGPALCTVRLLPTERTCVSFYWRVGPWQMHWIRNATRPCTGQPVLVRSQQSRCSWSAGPM